MSRPRLPVAAVLTALLLTVACSPDDTAPEEPSAEPGPTEPLETEEPDDAEPETEPDPEELPEEPAALAPGDALTRAAWVHLFDDALKTRENIQQVVADLVEADATAVIAEVVRRHDSYYASDVLPRTPDPTLEPDLDVLAALIEEADEAGLEVHAWIPLAPTWHAVYEDLPAPAGWLTADHGRTAPEAERWVSRTIDGTWDEYLDPGLLEVREHTVDMVAELADRYPVDGIHLDYVRYASNRHGYHPRALARYHEETGASGTPAPDDPAWSDWRREQVTELTRAAREAIDASGNAPVFSIAVISWGEGPGGPDTPSFAETRTYNDALQDWQRWAEEGLVDVLLPMNYFRESDADQARWLRTWLSFQQQLTERSGTRIVPGIGGYLNAPADSLRQIELATQHSGAAAMYSYQQSTSDPDRPLWRELAEAQWGD